MRSCIRSNIAFQLESIVLKLWTQLVMEFAVHGEMDITKLWLMVLQLLPVDSLELLRLKPLAVNVL